MLAVDGLSVCVCVCVCACVRACVRVNFACCLVDLVAFQNLANERQSFNLGKKSVFPITRPTHPFFADRLSFFHCATQIFLMFFLRIIYKKKKVNRTTLSNISAKIEKFLIFEEKSHSRDSNKYIAKKSQPPD